MPGPIQIKDAEVSEAARKLAALTGLSITEAVGRAIRAQLATEQVKANARLSEKRRQIRKILGDLHRLPIVGEGLSDQDLYDEEGLPR